LKVSFLALRRTGVPGFWVHDDDSNMADDTVLPIEPLAKASFIAAAHAPLHCHCTNLVQYRFNKAQIAVVACMVILST
jgi:hypothetical protein